MLRLQNDWCAMPPVKTRRSFCFRNYLKLPTFCQEQKQEFFGLAAPVEDHPVLRRMSALARIIHEAEK
jgi:hypothetical protein